MYRCIVTKYLGPTNSRGSRIVARSTHGKRVVPYDSALSERANHSRAAAEHAYDNGWIAYSELDAELAGGVLPTEDGYAFLVPA